MSVRAKQAGVEGMKLRVRVADLVLPASTSKKAADKAEGGEEPEAPASGGQEYSFNVYVEKESLSGGWKQLRPSRM